MFFRHHQLDAQQQCQCRACLSSRLPLTTPSLSLWPYPAVHTLSACCWSICVSQHETTSLLWSTEPPTPGHGHDGHRTLAPSQLSLLQSLKPLKLLFLLPSPDAITHSVHSQFLCLPLGCFTVHTFWLFVLLFPGHAPKYLSKWGALNQRASQRLRLKPKNEDKVQVFHHCCLAMGILGFVQGQTIVQLWKINSFKSFWKQLNT